MACNRFNTSSIGCFFALLCGVAAVLCSCSSNKHSEHEKQEAALSHMLYSPNGEPLNGGPLGRPTCQVAVAGWFDRVDGDHDNRISREEFMADARTQFLRMDIDRNGYLVSEELERFRRPYRQESVPGPSAPNQDADTQGKRGKHGGARNGHNGPEDDQPHDTTDPVMSADTDLDFKVTPAEFMVHAEKIFTALDSNQDGSLSRDEVLSQCPQKQ